MRPQTSSSIDEAPFTAFHWRLAIFANGGLFLDGYVLSNIGVALSLLISHFGLSAAQTGLLGGATLTGLFFGGLVFGYVTDKLGRKLMFTVDLVAILVCSILLFFVDEYWQLLVVRFVLGIAIGADYPIASALMTELTPRKYRGRVIGSTALAWASGAVTAYLVGYLLAGTGPEAWRWILASSAVPAALILLMRVGSPESPRWLVSKGRIDEAQAIVRDVFGPDATLDELPPDEEHKTSLTILFRREYRKRTAFTTLQWLLQAVTLFAIITFAPTILAALGLSEGREAFLGSVFIEVPLVLGGALYALWLLDAWGRRPGAILGFVGATVSFLVLAIVPDPMPWLVLAAFSLYSLLLGGANSLQLLYPNELFPTSVRATASGFGTAVSRIGACVGTFLLPTALQEFGVNVVMWACVVLSALGVWLCVAWAPETRGRRLVDASSVAVPTAPAGAELVAPAEGERRP